MIEPIWLQIARRYDGLAEVPGIESNPAILSMARAIGSPAWYHDDSQPWCAVFINAVLHDSGLPIATGTRGDAFDRLRALTFLDYGQGLVRPALGAIGVFSRPEGAHVALYLGEYRDLFYVFGGNQSDRVGKTWIRRSRLRGWRWPPKVTLPTSFAPIVLADNGQPASVNEA